MGSFRLSTGGQENYVSAGRGHDRFAERSLLQQVLIQKFLRGVEAFEHGAIQPPHDIPLLACSVVAATQFGATIDSHEQIAGGMR